MVSEIQVDDEETRDQLLQQGFLSTQTSIEKMGTFSFSSHLPFILFIYFCETVLMQFGSSDGLSVSYNLSDILLDCVVRTVC